MARCWLPGLYISRLGAFVFIALFHSGVVFTAKMVALKPAAQGAFFFQKVFGDGHSLGSGQLVIPPNSAKPAKSTKDNAFVRARFMLVASSSLTYDFVGVLCDPRRCQGRCASI